MPEWINFRNIHVTVRIITGVYLTTLVGWTLYRYYIERRRRRDQDGQFKRVDGDYNEDLEELDLVDENENEEDTSGYDEYSGHEEDEGLEDEEYKSQTIVDIEDMHQPGIDVSDRSGVKINRRPKKKQEPIDYSKFTKEQLNDRLRGDLSKQGYKLIESHSAVKICRWTKNSMRGRGGCYKHTFYGITSFACCEMTPNLACASKCTFCWRHHKNPTGTEWKWKMDPPDVIVEQALKGHSEMIQQLKGVPGVTKERFEEAQTVRHCALSLVGEPIFYPRINELLEILHAKEISTFLVTNAQFPDAMRHLVPVTQLYLSIDAPSKQALKKIDRPLYKDFWERYLECLKILSEKKQRTVFRLTLVQKANMEDLEGYAKLVDIGQPDFIEIKGVTYCGNNKLTMENVPWHEQVVEFARQLLALLPTDKYDLACEHSHSNCVLISDKKFKINGKWHTWIDYDRFFQLIKLQSSGVGEREDFTGLEYAAETPSWAIFGSEEGGFDPDHLRWIRKDHKLKLLKERIAVQNGENCLNENQTANMSSHIEPIVIEQQS